MKEYVKGGNPDVSNEEICVAIKNYWRNIRRQNNERDKWERRQLEARQRKSKRDRPRTGSQWLAKRHLPPSQRAHGPQRPCERGPSGSPDDTWHLPSTRKGPTVPVRGPSDSPNETCHFPSYARTPVTSRGVPADRQTTPATFPTHARAPLTLRRVPAAHKRHLAPSNCTHRPQRPSVGSQRGVPAARQTTPATFPARAWALGTPRSIPAAHQTTPDTFPACARAPATLRGVKGPAKRHLLTCQRTHGPQQPREGGPSGSRNDTFHLPSVRMVPIEPVQGPSSSPNDTCHLPSVCMVPSDPVRVVPVAHQTTPDTFPVRARAPATPCGVSAAHQTTSATFQVRA
ncbi:UNVERIFIED_CONTAM: hypothetical protein FKN15_075725 [Acipenser sinensis]